MYNFLNYDLYDVLLAKWEAGIKMLHYDLIEISSSC